MKHINWTKLGATAAVVVGLLACGPGSAWAFGHGGWGSSSSGSSSSGSWGSSSSSSSSGSWGGSWGWGGGWGWRHHHHRRYWVGYWGGSSSSGSWGSSSSGSSSSSSASSGWAPMQGAYGGVPASPAQPASPPPTPPTPPAGSQSPSALPGGSATPPSGLPGGPGGASPGLPGGDLQTPPPLGTGTSTDATSTSFRVSVPANAVVYVNDMKTTSTGPERRYVSRGLEPGRTYTFNVRAEYQRDGQTVTETRVIRLTAGRTGSLAFGQAAGSQPPQVAEKSSETKLTLHVPADAEVYLSGRETKQTGEVRRYTTTRLSPGDAWEDYVVRVTLERNGKTLSQERTITLVGGQPQQLEFAFAAAPAKNRLAATQR